MGLDMYLTVDRNFSGYDFFPKEKEKYLAICDILGLKGSKDSPNVEVSLTVVYWRKANAIHQWFVTNCQDGIDECQKTYVSTDKLKELVSLCNRAVATGDTSLLPTQSGFFFGSTEYDEWYWKDLLFTAKEISRVMEECGEDSTFYYQSSW